MMAIWQLILLFGNILLLRTSAAINLEDDDVVYIEPKNFTFKICMADGILESIKEATEESSNCSLPKASEYLIKQSEYSISLVSLGIREFKKNWYQINDPYFTYISLNNNNITDLSSNLVNDLPSNIKKILLAGNKIRKIDRNLRNHNLRELNLFSNEIIIEGGTFEGLEITDLFVNKNSLKSSEFIKFLPITIERLDLSVNLLREISHDGFSHLKNLRFVSLAKNQLTILEPGLFDNLPYLGSIYLSGNNISELKSGLFRNLNISDLIDLSDNRIEMIHPGAFESSNIEELSLLSNNLTIINGDGFRETWIGRIWFESDIEFKRGALTGFDTRRLK